jgi:hypothetical protein
MTGSYIWIDPRYTHFFRQPGHFFETSFKLLELRKRFPGAIDGYLLAREKTDLVDYVCQSFRLPFEQEDFQPPPVYFVNDWFPSKFEKVSKVDQSFIGLYDRYALRMYWCQGFPIYTLDLVQK